jgi:glycosyltransferase involved in cell wall biosynthesis
MEDTRPFLILCPLYPPVTGGLPNHAQQFNDQMATAGYSIVVFTPHLAPASLSEEHHGRVAIYRFPAWEIISNYPLPACWSPRFWRQLSRILRRHPRIVVSRTRFFITTPMAWLIARYLRKPWVHIEHGSGPIHLHRAELQALASAVDAAFTRLAFRRAQLLVANSAATARFMHRFAPKRAIVTIPRGVDSESIATIAAAKRPAELNRQVIIAYTGRLIDGKGLRELVQSLAALKDLPFHCYLVGDGPERTALQQLRAALGLKSYITFVGDVSWTQSIEWLKMCDIAVNPSYTEGLPTSIIEAALCKKAIVATAVGGTAEITIHQLLIPPRNVEALAGALRRLITDETMRHDMGLNAYEEVRQKFSWEGAVAAYLTAFSTIL